MNVKANHFLQLVTLPETILEVEQFSAWQQKHLPPPCPPGEELLQHLVPAPHPLPRPPATSGAS